MLYKDKGSNICFLFGCFGTLASVVIAYLGYPTQAVVFGSGTIVALVTVFLSTKRSLKIIPNNSELLVRRRVFQIIG